MAEKPPFTPVTHNAVQENEQEAPGAVSRMNLGQPLAEVLVPFPELKRVRAFGAPDTPSNSRNVRHELPSFNHIFHSHISCGSFRVGDFRVEFSKQKLQLVHWWIEESCQAIPFSDHVPAHIRDILHCRALTPCSSASQFSWQNCALCASGVAQKIISRTIKT